MSAVRESQPPSPRQESLDEVESPLPGEGRWALLLVAFSIVEVAWLAVLAVAAYRLVR